MRSVLITVLMSGLIGNCGTDGKKSAKNSGGTEDIPCTSSSCPQIELFILGTPAQGNTLVTVLPNSAPWNISGQTKGGASRDIRMMAFNPPHQGKFIGQNTLNIQAHYQATEPVASQVPIDVVIRDVSRCKYETKQDERCQDLRQPGLDSFERRFQYNWAITNGDINSFTDPTFTQYQGQKLGSNAGIKGCTDGLLQGTLGGLAQGSIIGTILGGAMGCISTSNNNLGQP